MKKHTFLVEIGTDEIPSKILKNLGKDFLKSIINECKKHNIHYNKSNWFAAPRHIAIKLNILITEYKNTQYHTYKHSQCLNDLKHSKFNTENKNYLLDQKINTNVPNKNKKNEPNNTHIPKETCLNKNYQNLQNLLFQITKNALNKLTNYKMMRWGNGNILFIRPINTITILLDDNIISGKLFEINIDRITYGHRCIQNNIITIHHANEYPKILMEKGYIIADYNTRKKIIQTAIEKQASKLGGVVDIRNEDFLEEITSSIEWPIVLFGRFDKKFLKLPTEVITHIIKKNQKYFPVYNIIDGILLPCFIFVINTITNNYKKIITGHENIIKTRFLDVEFFIKNDNQYRLEDYIPKLNSILFHRKLGNLQDKIHRITELSGWIAKKLNEDVFQAKRAGYLCKCDLMTDMVLEFPDMQGIIGMYYAQRDKEPKKVILAQKEHYQPRFTDDKLPTSKISCIVSIADKIDTISGVLGIKDFPTGNRDPFGLKRIATGILKIIIQKKISLNLFELIQKSVELYGSKLIYKETIENDIYHFLNNRLFLYYRLKNYEKNIIKSVLDTNIFDILSCNNKIQAIDNFYKSQKKENIKLSLTYKRISNILKKQNMILNQKTIISTNLFQDPKETTLFTQINESETKVDQLLQDKNYHEALTIIVSLSNLTNNFLDKIHIFDQNQNIRINRLSLLKKIQEIILKVINIPKLLT